MMVEYWYRNFKGERYGSFRADIEDFRKFCAYRVNRQKYYSSRDVHDLVVFFEDGRTFMWEAPKPSAKESENGWSRVEPPPYHPIQDVRKHND